MHFCLQADRVLPKTKDNSNNNNNIVAGWNEYVKEHKNISLFWHKEWLDNGRPHQGMIAYNIRKTRAKYHYAIKYVNKEKIRIRSDRMAQAISENDNRNLWSEAKKIKKTNNSIPNIVDNMSGSDNINELFTNKFKDLYNSVGFDSKDLETLMSKVDKLINKEHTEHKLNTDIIKKNYS